MALVALIGRPNVGKSSLFNRLIGERRAIEAAEPGTTRDRLYGVVQYRGKEVTLLDVAGLLAHESGELEQSIKQQIDYALNESDLLLFVVDVQVGLTNEDLAVAERLRKAGKPVVVVANKADNRAADDQIYQFLRLGFGDPMPTSAIHNSGLADLQDELLQRLPLQKQTKAHDSRIRIALLGRPNVGKSTLLNQYAGSDRAIVSSSAGTTRDAVDITINHKGHAVIFTDTAGIRRAGKIEVGIEKFAVLRSIAAIERTDIAVVLIDAEEGPTAGDARIAGLAAEAGRGVILAVNKWDTIENQKSKIKNQKTGGEESADLSKFYARRSKLTDTDPDQLAQRHFLAKLQRQFAYMPWAPVVFISALEGLHTRQLLDQAHKVFLTRQIRLGPEVLDSVKKAAESTHTRLPLIYSIAESDTSPPTFVLQVNRPETWHFSHLRFIENLIRQAEPFNGTPVEIKLEKYHKSS